jgi:signal peptidase I
MNETIGYRRSWLAAFLSFLVNGLGQLYCGRPGRAALLLALTFLIVIAVYLSARVYPRAYEHSSWLFVALAASAIIKVYATVDAWLLARRTKALRLRWYNRWYVYTGIVLATALIGFTSPYRSYSIPTASMAPTVLPGDYIMAEKYSGAIQAPRPGDIAIFTWEGTPYIKRIVAIGGDHVQMIDGRLVINGTTTPRLQEGDITFRDESRWLYRETLSDGRSYEVMEVSDKEFLDNTIEFVLPADCFFVLGDNRDNSRDSRVASFGCAPAQSMIGRVILVWWAKDWSRIGTAPE